MIRVLVADDEPLIRAGICSVLAAAPGIEVAAQAGDGRAAIAEAASRQVDVALVDIKMPGLDGLALLRELRRQLPALPVVMLTSFGTEDNALRALELGAAGFVLKNCTPAELVRAIQAAHDGEAYLSPAVTRYVLGLISPADLQRRQLAARRLAALTGREQEVLALLAEGMPNAGIGRQLHMSEATIKAYVSRILAKLGCANRVEAALLAREARTG